MRTDLFDFALPEERIALHPFGWGHVLLGVRI